MPLKPWVWISSLLLLSGCATDSQDQGVQSEYLALMKSANEKTASAGAAAQGTASASQTAQETAVNPEDQGISDENLAAMAQNMVMDIPNSPALETQAGRATILVQAQHFKLGEGIELNTSLLAHRLLLAFQHENSRSLDFVSMPQGGSRTSKSGFSGSGGGKGGGGSKSSSSSQHGQRSNTYRLEGDFSNLTPTAQQESARRYEFQLVDVRTNRAIWMGSFDINIPKPKEPESAEKP